MNSNNILYLEHKIVATGILPLAASDEVRKIFTRFSSFKKSMRTS
jgi:hypothetical protein